MEISNFYNQRENYRIRGVRLGNIMSLVPEDASAVLDVGCGNGGLAGALKARGCLVTGIDISEKAINEAGVFLENGFCFDIGSEKWPEELMEKKFDLIIASEVIEHIFDPDSFLKKIGHLLAPDGKIIITTPNILFWKNRLKMFFGRFKYERSGLMDYGHIRFFTVDTLKEAFKNNCLAVIGENHFYPNLHGRKLDRIGGIFPGLFAFQMIFLLKPDKKRAL